MLARWVAGASDERLESVMRSPLRAVLLSQILRTTRQRFDPARSRELDAVVEFAIRRPGRHGVDHCQIALVDGRCTTQRRGNQVPTVVLALDSVSFLRLAGGAIPAATLLLSGRLRVRGDLLLAARLPRLLGIPRSPQRRRRRVAWR